MLTRTLAALALFAILSISASAHDVGGWIVVENHADAQWRWSAANPSFPGLRIELEMLAPEKPELLVWEEPERYSGIGLLRYYAGEPGTSVLVRVEQVVIIDLKNARVIGVAPYLAGEDRAAWEWGDAAVTVTDPWDGSATTYQLAD